MAHAPIAAKRVAPIAVGRIEDDITGFHDDISIVDGAVDGVAQRQVEQEQPGMFQLVKKSAYRST